MAWDWTQIKQPCAPDSSIMMACTDRFAIYGSGTPGALWYTILDSDDDTAVAYSQGGLETHNYTTGRCSYGGKLYFVLATGNWSAPGSVFEVDPVSSPDTLTMIASGMTNSYRPYAMIGKYFGSSNKIVDVTSGTVTTFSGYGVVRGTCGGYFVCSNNSTTTAYLVKTDGTLHRSFTLRSALANQYDTTINLSGDWITSGFVQIPSTTIQMVNPLTDATLDVSVASGLSSTIFTLDEAVSGYGGLLYGTAGISSSRYVVAVDPLTGRWHRSDTALAYVYNHAVVLGGNVYAHSSAPNPWPGGW